VQVPVLTLKVPPGWHDVQPEAVPSVQLAHEGSHAWQVLLASAYLLAGQDATHAPLSSYGVPLTGQDRQLVDDAPLQVAHDAWQERHVP